MLARRAYAAGSYWVEATRIGPLPQVLGMSYGALATSWSSCWPSLAL